MTLLYQHDTFFFNLLAGKSGGPAEGMCFKLKMRPIERTGKTDVARLSWPPSISNGSFAKVWRPGLRPFGLVG